MRRDEHVERGLGVEVVDRFLDRDAGFLGETSRDDPRELWMRVDAGANRGPTQRHPRELVDGCLGAADRFFDLSRVTLELLAEADGSRVLQVSAARLDHGPELLALRRKRALQPLERRDELVLDRARRSELDGGGDHVVGRLAEVDVVVGMDELRSALTTKDLRGAVGDDLVGVRVGRRARARLVHVDRKLVVQLALDHLLRRRGDGAGPASGQEAELAVGLRGRALDHAEGAEEARGQRLAGDGEVQHRALRRGAVVRVGRDSHLAHGVAFHASPSGHAVILEFRSDASGRARHRIQHHPRPCRRRGARQAGGGRAPRRDARAWAAGGEDRARSRPPRSVLRWAEAPLAA